MTKLFEDFLSVVLKLFDAVLNVPKSSVVSSLLRSCFKHLQYNDCKDSSHTESFLPQDTTSLSAP